MKMDLRAVLVKVASTKCTDGALDGGRFADARKVQRRLSACEEALALVWSSKCTNANCILRESIRRKGHSSLIC